MTSTSKQQQQQQYEHHRLNIHHSRNTNAYFDRNEYYRQEQSIFNSIPPRHRKQYSSSLMNKSDELKPFSSTSLSSVNSDISNHFQSIDHPDFHMKNLAASVLAIRQQNYQPQTNLNMIQTLMNSLILQQQQQQQQHQSSHSPSTIQLQYQLTNALLATMIQQRLKETVLQVQAQQIQAAIPTLLAAQALAYHQQQSGQLNSHSSSQPLNLAHPGTKFNNHPLVKFPVVRSPTIMPIGQSSQHRTNTQSINSTTILPTYQQVQEIERGISLDEAIHFKGAINITDIDKMNPTKFIE